MNPVDVQIDPPQLLPRYNENYVGAPSITNYHHTGTPPNNVYKIIAAPSRTLGEAKINIFCLDASWQWSAMQSFFSSFTSHDIWAPSVSSIDRTPCSSDFDNVRCAFNLTDHTVYPTAYRTLAVDVACGAWTMTDPQVDDAIHPSVVAFPPADRGRGVHIDLLSTAVPQALTGDLRQIGNTDVSLNKTTARSRLRGARMLWLTVDTTHAGVGIGNLSLNARGVSDPLAWHAKAATTPISSAAAAAAHIRSEAFVPASQTELSLQTLQERSGSHTLPAYSMLSLELVDASTGMVVEVLASIDAANLQSGRSLATLTKDLSAYSGRSVFVRLRPTASATQASIAVAEYYNLDPSSSSAFPKTAAEQPTPAVTAAPSEIRLEQNYPNPFNPTTTLALYLPQSSYATLVVYDQMGRIVATLLDAETDAGYHTLAFDATHLPSGVYYAKLTVRDMTVTRSMTLLR